MKYFFSILAFVLLNVFSVAQNSGDFFKTIPAIDKNTPKWAVLMYSSDPHVPSVINAYNDYYKENPFVKTVHTQNFKHWVRKAETLLNERGFISIPDKISEDQFRSRLEEKYQNRSTALKVVGADQEWVAMGPFETYKENSTELSKNHKNIYAVDQSESNPDLLICGTEAGGIYKSVDKGVNWSLITKDAVFVGGNTAVKIHPTNEDFFLAASNRRIFLSTDGGLTWSEKHFTDGTGHEFKFHPEDNDTIFHVSSTGLFRSNDGGDTWMQEYSDACYDIDFHPNNSDILYLLKSNPSEVRSELFRSDDAGDTWTLKDNGWYSPADPPNASDGGGKIGVTSASPDLVYVCLIGASKAGDDGWIGIYKSDDQGDTWTDQDGQDGGPYGAINGTSPWNVAAYSGGYHQGFYNFDMEVSANDPDKLWVATIRLSESTDGGASFQSIGAANSVRFADVHADVQGIEVIGDDIWIATDGGLNYSNDELVSQTVLHKGIQASHFWGFNTGWNEDTYVGGKYHDGTTGWFEDYGLGKAHHIGGVEEATGYVDPINSRKLLYRTHYSSPNTSVKTIPKTLGDPVINHPSFPLRANEAYTLGQSSGVYYDYRYSNHIYIGRDNKVYKSTNGGISFDVLYSFANPSSMVYEIEISRSNPDVIYCILNPDGGYWTEDEIWKSTDGGNSWARIDNFSGNRRRMFITINPSDEDEVWICQANGANGNKVQRTTDGGTTWTNMTTATLDEEPMRDILYQGGSNGIVYVAGLYDVFYWDDMANDWMNYSQGLPLIVKTLRLNPFYRDGELRLGTGGRGVWARAMEDTLFSPIAQAITYSDSIFCAHDTVQFECYSILKHQGASWDWSIDPAPDYISSTTARNPKVVFGQNGSYDVTLSITDGKGDMDSKTWTNMVSVESLCDVDTVPGNALSLSGIYNSYANIPALDLNTNTLTITAWIRANGNQNDWAGIVFSRDGSTTAGLNIGTNNQLRYHWNGGNWGWNSGHTIPLGEWTHVALVVEADKTVIYMNGVPSTHFTFNNIEEFNGVTRIGADSHSSGRRFVGEVDEVCIWNRALDMNEIRELRHLTKEDVIDDINLVAYYQFNEGKGEIAYDRTGNGYHASLKSENVTRVTSDAPIGGGISNCLVH